MGNNGDDCYDNILQYVAYDFLWGYQPFIG